MHEMLDNNFIYSFYWKMSEILNILYEVIRDF